MSGGVPTKWVVGDLGSPALLLVSRPLSVVAGVVGVGSLGLFTGPAFVLHGFVCLFRFDQGLRFSVDRPTYELLYLPIAPGERVQFKNAIDIVVNRIADAIGAVLFGVATMGFFMLPGIGLGVRGTAVLNLALIGVWLAVASRLRNDRGIVTYCWGHD